MTKMTIYYYRNSKNVKIYVKQYDDINIFFKDGYQLVARKAITNLQLKERFTPRKTRNDARDHRLSNVSYIGDPMPVSNCSKPSKRIKRGRFSICFS